MQRRGQHRGRLRLPAAQQARDNGFPEWAAVLKSGWAGPEVLG
jgi:hypothetical protein